MLTGRRISPSWCAGRILSSRPRTHWLTPWESKPAAWSVTSISDGGGFAAVNGKVKWGLFLENVARRLHYQVTPPGPARALVRQAGLASFGGASVTLAGPSALRAGCRMAIGFQAGSQGLVLRLVGEAGPRGVIETAAPGCASSEPGGSSTALDGCSGRRPSLNSVNSYAIFFLMLCGPLRNYYWE